MAIIALEGIRCFAYHGLYPEEQKNGNYFEVDVYLDTGNKPLPDSDLIGDTYDYAFVYQVVKEVMEDRKNLLESLVNSIGDRLLREMNGLEGIKVRVTKENPPVEGTCRRSYVESDFMAGK